MAFTPTPQSGSRWLSLSVQPFYRERHDKPWNIWTLDVTNAEREEMNFGTCSPESDVLSRFPLDVPIDD
jgi:hypothetical protein